MKKNKIFIIAEAGVNHNGSLKKAFKLVDIAKNSGADLRLSAIGYRATISSERKPGF